MDRKSYLINRSLKVYLAASIVTMAVMNLNGILMGRIIGPDALSAINASMPLNSMIAVVDTIFANGAAKIEIVFHHLIKCTTVSRRLFCLLPATGCQYHYHCCY